ncbi:MAG TPA: hypothetical protein VKI20_07010, partial [Acidimicrobiales bacterium]|nr:hypothetical protein [Acidimicrobiales bacterium]
PVGDQSQALAVGKKVFPQSTQRRQPYYLGVTDNAIRLVYSTDQQTCGINALTAVQAAGGALPTTDRFTRPYPTTADQQEADRRESIQNVVKYFNEHAFDVAAYLPNIRPLMGNDPNNQLFGRHLEASFVDGGSFQCPDKTTAAAKQAAETIKGFSVFTDLLDANAGFNMAGALNAEPAPARPMHFGTEWLSDQYYNRFAPFAWTSWATGTTVVKGWASYVCARLNGQNASRSPDAVLAAQKRKFGLVYPGFQEVKTLANEFKGYLNQFCGGNVVAKEIQYSTDIAAAQTDATNMIVQLKTSGVTSVLMLTDLLFPLFQMNEASRQSYHPEWIFSSFGLLDVSAIQRIYPTDETKGDFGVSNLGVPGGFGYTSGDPFTLYHSYHQVSPKDGKPCDPSSDAGMDHDPTYCKEPASMSVWYYVTLPFYGGVLFAGPDLTPQNLSNGLQAYPQTRYGGSGPTTDPRPALVGAGRGKYGFLVDNVEWRWRPDFNPPPPEGDEKGKNGWVEYPDCQRHYILWGDQLAVNWEKGGPNDGTWCGNPKYAPANSPSKDNYPRTN